MDEETKKAKRAAAERHPLGGFRFALETAGLTLKFLLLLIVVVSVSGFLIGSDNTAAPSGEFFSVIKIEGTITDVRGFGETGYDQQAAVRYIKEIADNPGDRGILLYMDTPGGTLYHSEEIYLALLDYKEKTERPVYAYMASTCASGGYYICMAADYIMASRTAITGSIGVIMSMFDYNELFEKLGVRSVVIDTGEHKGAGAMGTVVTPSQEAVLQSIVGEFYDGFVGVIVQGRGMDLQTVQKLADGRIFSPRQALENNLIDEIGSWDKALADFGELTGTEAYYPYLSSASFMGSLFMQASKVFPQSDVQATLTRTSKLPSGVPLAVAPELLN
jgi:protease-4